MKNEMGFDIQENTIEMTTVTVEVIHSDMSSPWQSYQGVVPIVDYQKE
ncbi:hypothetical protein [Halobacillus litoralis]|nr:hypothetical protein [Halobacillus litoralis]MCA1021789.1 hypothetical protein [Halobacillus litoralis]